jgi:hypothetical protein
MPLCLANRAMIIQENKYNIIKSKFIAFVQISELSSLRNNVTTLSPIRGKRNRKSVNKVVLLEVKAHNMSFNV